MKYVVLTNEEVDALDSLLTKLRQSPEVTYATSQAEVCEDCGEDPCSCEAEAATEDPIITEGKQLMKEFGYVD